MEEGENYIIWDSVIQERQDGVYKVTSYYLAHSTNKKPFKIEEEKIADYNKKYLWN